MLTVELARVDLSSTGAEGIKDLKTRMESTKCEEALVARMSELDQHIANIKREMLLEGEDETDELDLDGGDDEGGEESGEYLDPKRMRFSTNETSNEMEVENYEQAGKHQFLLKSRTKVNSIMLKNGVVSTIQSFKKPSETSHRVPKQKRSIKTQPVGKFGKAFYKTDESLPSGWTYLDNGKGQMFFRDEKGKFIKNRRHALAEMAKAGSPLEANGANAKFTQQEISFIRNGLVLEGWSYAIPLDRLPHAWLYKKYRHSIEGVDTDVLYLVAPNGSILRSKVMLKRCWKDLGLSESDLKKLLDFKPDGFQGPDDIKRLENPDDQWVYDPAMVPEGWMVKKYTFNSSHSKKVDEVFHYLTPCKQIVRGRKQVLDYLSRTGTFSPEAFSRFPFNKAPTPTSPTWGQWEDAVDLPAGWKVRSGAFQAQTKRQYKSPVNQVFQSRSQVERLLKDASGGPVLSMPRRRQKQQTELLVGGGSTVWAEWRSDDIPCLPGWQFSVGRQGERRKIRYRSPQGLVFQSRGPLINYLFEKQLVDKQKLRTLKNLLRTNQGLTFDESRRNDKFIKHFSADQNLLFFVRQRYQNQVNIEEKTNPKLPEGWKVKTINGVEYFKTEDETGCWVFYNRRLVVDFLRQNKSPMTQAQMVEFLEEGDPLDPESELSDNEGEGSC